MQAQDFWTINSITLSTNLHFFFASALPAAEKVGPGMRRILPCWYLTLRHLRQKNCGTWWKSLVGWPVVLEGSWHVMASDELGDIDTEFIYSHIYIYDIYDIDNSDELGDLLCCKKPRVFLLLLSPPIRLPVPPKNNQPIQKTKPHVSNEQNLVV